MRTFPVTKTSECQGNNIMRLQSIFSIKPPRTDIILNHIEIIICVYVVNVIVIN